MTPKPWSFSSLEKFVNCPKRYHEIVVLRRIKDEDGEGARYGNLVHEQGEAYLKAKGQFVFQPNPPHLNGFPQVAKYKDYFDAILRLPGEIIIEKKLALNIALQPVEFFAKDVWVRGKADVIALDGDTARGLDHKTGKRKGSRQMVLMALMLFYHYPQVQRVKTAFFWMKTNEMDMGEYVRSDIPSMWNQFVTDLKQYREAYATDTWQPRQSGLCYGWCPVTTCEFWKPSKPRSRS